VTTGSTQDRFLLGVGMPDIHWVKLSTAMFDDEKIKVIRSMPSGSEICLLWINLIVLAGKTNDNGFIRLSKDLPYTDDMLSKICDQPVEIVRCALDAFLRLGMIERMDSRGIVMVNWDRYQNVDGMERVRLLTAERTRRSREKQKLLGSVTRSATVTLCNAIDSDSDSDSDSDKDKKENTAPSRSTVSVPKPTFNFETRLWDNITADSIKLWEIAYPACDINTELAKMAAWLIENPEKRKTRYGRFIIGWLARTQNHGGTK
jgi:predicted phage replisome organizer